MKALKVLTLQVKKSFCSKKGETLVEGIVSLLVLSILILAITTMVQIALRVTRVTTQNAQWMQEDVINQLVLSEYEEEATVEITFTAKDEDINIDIEAKHDVIFNNDGGFIAFSPLIEPEGDEP